MGKTKTKLEKLAPEQVMVDQQLFVTDRTGHESHSIKKLRAKAGKAPLSAAAVAAAAADASPSRDTSYDNHIPRKRLHRAALAVAAQVAASLPAPHEAVANFGNARAEAARKAAAAEAESGKKRKRPSRVVETDAVRDLWNETVPVLNPVLDNGQTMYELSKVPRTYKHDRRPNAAHVLSSIALPHPGTSFNPARAAHQEAIEIAAKVATQESEARHRLHTTVAAPLNRLGRVPVVSLLAAPLPLDEEEEEENEHDAGASAKRSKHTSDGNGGGANSIVSAEQRQTTKQRNKQERKAAAQKAADQKNASKALVAQIDQIDDIAAELARAQAARETERAATAALKLANATHRPRLGPAQFKPAFPHVALSEDIKGTMAAMRPLGAPVAEAFNNLQRRNLIETRHKNSYTRRYDKQVLKPRNVSDE